MPKTTSRQEDEETGISFRKFTTLYSVKVLYLTFLTNANGPLCSWREKSKGSKANGARDDVLAALSQAQQNGNTTRGLTPGPDLQGNVIPMLATRRSRASNTASSSNALPAPAVNPSTGPSAQAQKAAPGPNKRRRVNLNEDTDDEDVDDIPVAAPKPKRRRTAVTTYVVDDDSEDSAASEYGPDPAPSRSKRQRESLSEVDEVVGIPDAGSSRSRMPERQPETGRSGHRNKKQKVNDIQVEDDAGPSLHQQPHLPFGQNAQRRSDSHRQPRIVQEVRTNRLHRLPPRSTSYATTLPEPNPYTGHGGYGDTPFVNNGYLSTYGPNPLPFPGYITANVANDWTTQMAPEGFANEFGYGNVTSQLYAPTYGVNSFAPTGQMQRVQQVDDGNTSASGRVHRIANEAVQPWQDQAFNDVLVRHQQKQRRESSRSIPAVANPGHDSVEGGYRHSQTNVARSENNEVPAPIGNFPERQNDNGRNNILVEDYQAQPSRRPSDRRTDSSAPVTDMPPQAAEPQRQQVVQQSQTQMSDGQNAGRAHTSIAHPQPIRPMMSVGNPTPPTDAACEAPQQFSEADLLFHDDDLSSWPSDPALWNPEWNAFLDFHDAEPLLRAHNVDKNL